MNSISNQVARVRLKRYETTIQADLWENTGAIARIACRVFADSLRRSRGPVAQVNLVTKLEAGDEVFSERTIDDKATVATDVRPEAQAVSCFAGVIDTYDLGRSCLPIAYVNLI